MYFSFNQDAFLAVSDAAKHLIYFFVAVSLSGAVSGKQPDWGNLRDSFQSDQQSECRFSEAQQAGWDEDRPHGLDQPQVRWKEDEIY